MERVPETPISIGEYFLIRDAEALKPITASVIGVRCVEDEEGIWQRVGLRRLGKPRTSFEISTSRRTDYGAYINRDGRYTFLRLAVLPIEELLKYFNNGKRQLAEEFIESNPGYAINR